MKPIVEHCRKRLREGRIAIRQQHDAGSPSIQVSARLTDLYDEVVAALWAEACGIVGCSEDPGGIALVAHGGYGRRDIAPYSDADVMLLTSPASAGLAAKIANPLLLDMTDVGLDVGFSIRTTTEACALAWGDPVIFSSLSESRFFVGNESLFNRFFEGFRRGAMRRHSRLLSAVTIARREERRKWGESNFLLRPNVKRSRGGLRDIQLIRWLGFARYGETDLQQLYKLDVLPEEDYRLLQAARMFMLRLRNELHFRESKSQDVLDRSMQLSIAEDWGYTGTEGVLPVEQFMQDYFEHTRNVRYAAAFFRDDTRSQPRIGRVLEYLRSRHIDEDIRMGPTHIWVRDSGLERFAESLPDVLRLIYLANHHSKRISHKTWVQIRTAMQERRPGKPDSESINYFLGLLGRTGRLPSLLRRLHELRVLEQIIPAFTRCRGLLQFNAYHKFTVDTHCIRAVEAATKLEDDETGMGRRYRRLKDKTLLHLSLLIHDLGKGYEEDHSEVGKRIAKETADLLGLDEASSETLQWLIHKHLAVNEVAFRHDLNDPDVVLPFAAEVASVRRLELLIVHSVADLEAVGPGVVTDWKLSLIEDLYLRTRRYFETGNLPGENDPEIEKLRGKIQEILLAQDADPHCSELLDGLPLSLIRRNRPEQVCSEIVEIAAWHQSDEPSLCTATFGEQSGLTRYTVVCREAEQRVGAFARVTGALSSCGLGILRANIETIEAGPGRYIVWDDFWVSEPDHVGEPPAWRIDEVCEKVRKTLDSTDEPTLVHRRVWAGPDANEPDEVNVLPTKVTFDNDTFDHYTILSVFAYDQVGFLYQAASVLAEYRVVLHFAKIDTHLDQIADVFYVTEEDGGRILGPSRQRKIRQALIDAVG